MTCILNLTVNPIGRFFLFAVTTESSDEHTTPTNLPSTNAVTTDGETTPPPTAPPIELVTLRGPRTDDPVISVHEPSVSQGDLSTGIQIAPVIMNKN